MIIVKPKELGYLPKISHLIKSWYGNSHGAGYGYSKDGESEVHYKKGFSTLKDFIESYENEPFYKSPEGYTVCIHFRIATYGGAKPLLTHPFLITENLAIDNPLMYNGEKEIVFHNGARLGIPTNKDGYSDTMEYVEEVLVTMDKELRKEMNERIGHNKLVFLSPGGEYEIVNESMGMWLDGIWFSNKYI